MFFFKSKELEKADWLIRTTPLELALRYDLMAYLAKKVKREARFMGASYHMSFSKSIGPTKCPFLICEVGWSTWSTWSTSTLKDLQAPGISCCSITPKTPIIYPAATVDQMSSVQLSVPSKTHFLSQSYRLGRRFVSLSQEGVNLRDSTAVQFCVHFNFFLLFALRPVFSLLDWEIFFFFLSLIYHMAFFFILNWWLLNRDVFTPPTPSSLFPWSSLLALSISLLPLRINSPNPSNLLENVLIVWIMPNNPPPSCVYPYVYVK